MFTRMFSIITVFLLTVQIISAQKIFQQPKTISQVVGKQNYENKVWAYQNSPQYVQNTFYYNYTCGLGIVPDLKSPVINSANTYKSFEIRGVNYQDRLTFFCRQEYKFEKNTKIPLRVRVGSLDYTNYLERKINATYSERKVYGPLF